VRFAICLYGQIVHASIVHAPDGTLHRACWLAACLTACWLCLAKQLLPESALLHLLTWSSALAAWRRRCPTTTTTATTGGGFHLRLWSQRGYRPQL
jgi:hypothetical protein